MKLNLWLSLSAKQGQNPCSFNGHHLVYQDLPKHHDWPVEKAIDLLANQVKGKLLLKHCKSEITKKGSKSSGDIT